MKYKSVLFATCCFLSATSAALASPVGMICKTEGSPTLRSAGKQSALRNMTRLEPGDVVSCSAGEKAVVVLFKSGERFEVGANQKGTVQAGSVQGGRSLGKLGGPSASVSRELGNSRAGAVMGRNVGKQQHLNPENHGWMVAGDRHFAWTTIPDAISYTFTLFDRTGNILWSTRLTGTEADYPAELPAMDLKKPYLWRLSGFKTSGKPLVESRWGVLTWLSPEDKTELEATNTDLQKQAAVNPESATPLLQQLAVLFSNYGVYAGTLDILGKMDEDNVPGAREAYATACNQLGEYASYLAGVPAPSDEAESPTN